MGVKSEQDWLVEVWIYDLSRGMARQLSMPLLGRHIEGIWHSSIVVYGEEYFYGGGISVATPPGTTAYGIPVRKVPLGRTQIARALFHEFLDDIRPKYHPQRYHLLDNNCNHFSNDAAVFLTGNTIPEDVRNLPHDVMATPFGPMLRSWMDNMFQQQPSETVQPYVRSSDTTILPSLSSTEMTTTIHHVASLDELLTMIGNHRGVLVDFDSPHCGPCVALAPTILQLSRLYPEILFCRVNVATHPIIARHYNIQATPTLLVFVHGQLIETFQGVVPTERIETTLRIASTTVKEDQTIQQRQRLIESLPDTPILFVHMQVPAVFRKLRSLSSPPSGDLSGLEAFLTASSATTSSTTTSNKDPCIEKTPTTVHWLHEALQIYALVSEEGRFILIDIIRMLILSLPSAQLIWDTTSPSEKTLRDPLLKLFETYLMVDDQVSRAPRLMAFRLACNLFVHSEKVSQLLADPPLIRCFFTGVTNGTLSEDVSIREVAASLSFNMSLHISKLASSYHESLVEFVCALHHVLTLETSDETRKFLILIAFSLPPLSLRFAFIGHRLLCALAQVLLSSNNEITELLITLGFIDYLGHLTLSPSYSQPIRMISGLLIHYLNPQ
jgi:thiol-disulfide isomerase/thioredoxin